MEKSGLDWFSSNESTIQPFGNVMPSIDSEEDLKELEQKVVDAKANSGDSIEYNSKTFDISNDDEVARILNKVKEAFGL